MTPLHRLSRMGIAWFALGLVILGGCTVDRSGIDAPGTVLFRRDGGNEDGGTDAGQPPECLRDADCPERECGPFGACEFNRDNVCDPEGVRTRTCRRFVCQAGACAAVEDGAETEPCHRHPEEQACGKIEYCTACQCNVFGYCRKVCWPYLCRAAECVLDYEQSYPVECVPP